MSDLNKTFGTVGGIDFGFPNVEVALAKERPSEVAFQSALKERAGLRESVQRLRDQIKPALQAELTEKSAAEGSSPEPPKSPVVRDFDNLRYEIGKVSSLVRSISNRVYL
jgi:hypothetical protein